MAARHVLAVLLASLSALLHATLQLLRRSLGCASEPFFQMFLVKLFGQTSKNVQIRSSQLLYWSFFLHGAGPWYDHMWLTLKKSQISESDSFLVPRASSFSALHRM